MLPGRAGSKTSTTLNKEVEKTVRYWAQCNPETELKKKAGAMRCKRMIKQLSKEKTWSPYRLCSVRSLPGHPQTPSPAASPPLDHCARFCFSAMTSNIPSAYSSSLGFAKKHRRNALTHRSTNSPNTQKKPEFYDLGYSRSLCLFEVRAAQQTSPVWWTCLLMVTCRRELEREQSYGIWDVCAYLATQAS